jgi:hypothetical protein
VKAIVINLDDARVRQLRERVKLTLEEGSRIRTRVTVS